MPKKLTVAVIFGGTSAERPVSLQTGAAVAAACRRLGHRVSSFDSMTDIPKIVSSAKKIDVAYIALHGQGGEDGAMQSLLELLGIPYVGSGVRASAIAFDKPTTKTLYRAVGLPVARDVVIPKNASTAFATILKTVGVPCFVKPVADGSSFGATKVLKKSELLPALKKAWRYGDALVEELLHGREITIGVLDIDAMPRALPIVEIISKTAFFDFKAKYDARYSTEVCPAELPATIAVKAGELAVAAHRALGCRDLSRTDMFVVGRQIYLLETNTLPGMTDNSLIPKMARAAGLTFDALIARLLTAAQRRGVRKNHRSGTSS